MKIILLTDTRSNPRFITDNGRFGISEELIYILSGPHFNYQVRYINTDLIGFDPAVPDEFDELAYALANHVRAVDEYEFDTLWYFANDLII